MLYAVVWVKFETGEGRMRGGDRIGRESRECVWWRTLADVFECKRMHTPVQC